MRLRGSLCSSSSGLKYISIPSGAIKSKPDPLLRARPESISIPSGAIKRIYNIILFVAYFEISIPSGAIKSILIFVYIQI